MPEHVVLWGPPDVDGFPEGTEDNRLLSAWMKKCADHGVTKVIDGSARVLPARRADVGPSPGRTPGGDEVILFLSEVRARIKRSSPEAVLSTTIIAGEPEDYIKVLQDWPAWIEQGLLDEFYLWFRTDSDLEAVRRRSGTLWTWPPAAFP